jgi:hypothetical protein
VPTQLILKTLFEVIATMTDDPDSYLRGGDLLNVNEDVVAEWSIQFAIRLASPLMQQRLFLAITLRRLCSYAAAEIDTSLVGIY